MTVPPKSKARPVYCLIFLLLLFANQAYAAEKGTVKLKNGQEYKDVEYEINDFYKTVLLKFDDQKINVNFSDIESITVQDTRDVTSQVLSGQYHPQNEEWQPKEPGEVKKAQAKTWEALITVGANYSAPTGQYYDGIDGGIGFGGDFRFAFNNRFAVQFIVSRSGMRLGDEYHLYSYNTSLTILDEDLSFHATRFEAAINVFEPLSRRDNPRNMWYVLAGLGSIQHTAITKGTVRNDITGEIIKIDERQSNSKFVIVIGLGAIKMISKNIGFDLGGTMDIVSIPTGSDEPGQGMSHSYIFDLKLSAVAVF
jgi:hypothetical protein